jgi:hypothetical protein
MATNDNSAKRDNRVWLSLRKKLVPVREKLLELYEDEDIYVEGLIPLAKKHGCLPDISEEAGPNLEMNMHLHAPIQSAMRDVSGIAGGQ